MHFSHSERIWQEFPELTAGAMAVTGRLDDRALSDRVQGFTAIASERLLSIAEAEMPEIQAWRRAFSRMGLKPTQYRCASEALLRRFRKDQSLQRIHPLVDLCNAVSLALALPIATFDIDRIAGDLVVRHAAGTEVYLTFGGDIERPDPGEVIFADGENRAHARRWSNRQSGYSAVRTSTTRALIVVEAMHTPAFADVQRAITSLADLLRAHAVGNVASTMLTRHESRFDF